MIEPASPRRKNSLVCAVSFLFAALLWPTAWGFASAAIGDKIADVVLPGIDGGQHHLFTDAAVNVFVYFKPGQEHSEVTLRQFAQLEKELAGKPVRWVAIVSDRIPRAEVEASRQAAGIAMPVLIDVDHDLFGRLGVTLEPSTGIVDADHRLVAYQPFTKVNYAAVVRARIRHLLQEIDEAELARVIHPPAATNSSDLAAAQRRLKLAEKLFQAKQYPQALANVKSSIEKDPSAAAAHALMGQILAVQDQRDEALRAFDRALELEPANADAQRGKADLENRSTSP